VTVENQKAKEVSVFAASISYIRGGEYFFFEGRATALKLFLMESCFCSSPGLSTLWFVDLISWSLPEIDGDDSNDDFPDSSGPTSRKLLRLLGVGGRGRWHPNARFPC